MSEDPLRERLKRLEEKISAADEARSTPSSGQDKYTQSSLAWRMVTELVAGMLLGVGIGFGLDTLLGTMPWFLMIFAILGFVAGVRVMMRTADEVRKRRGEGARLAPDPGQGDAGPSGADKE